MTVSSTVFEPPIKINTRKILSYLVVQLLEKHLFNICTNYTKEYLVGFDQFYSIITLFIVNHYNKLN